MPIKDFDLKEELGKGSFGKVIKVIRKQDGSAYAMKQIKLSKLKQKDRKNALNQIRFLASIKHPNVVGYREAFYDEKTQNLCVVMDLASEGDLSAKIKNHIQNKMRIEEEFIWEVAFNILSGLNIIHSYRIIHRDIKPANIFFNQGKAQIGDLNIAKHLKDPFTQTQIGTPCYASPEVWSEEPYNFKCDVWSLGCVLYEMAMLKPPFRAETPQKLFKKILLAEHEKLSSFYSSDLENFINKMLIYNPNKRPSAEQLLCMKNMLNFTQPISEQIPSQLMETIKFPSNLKKLNSELPSPQYEGTKYKTAKIIKKSLKQKSQKLLLGSSLKLIKSEPFLEMQNSKGATVLRKVKILNKNGSQKLL